tara:strand:- start:339 stop:926 length:588 start_codon:yes stop_codon:yes gene_type:complete
MKRNTVNKKLKRPINRSFKYEQSGASKIEIPNLKFNIDIRKVAELAKKRELRGEGLDQFDFDELREKKREKLMAKRDRISTKKLKAEKGEFVLLDGSGYNRYYHIADDGVIMTEATFIDGVSQPLISREDWANNKETYLIISERLDYKNPYRKRNINKNRNPFQTRTSKVRSKLSRGKGISGKGGTGHGGAGGGY